MADGRYRNDHALPTISTHITHRIRFRRFQEDLHYYATLQPTLEPNTGKEDMGLPIWRESDSAKEVEQKPKTDLTAHHGQARSSIRRHPSVRISNNARNPYTSLRQSQGLRRAVSRSPPPDPPSRDIPPVPGLNARRQLYRDNRHESRRARRNAADADEADLTTRYNDARLTQPWLPPLPSAVDPLSAASQSFSAAEDPLPDQYRPRRMDARSAALAEMPPLRRMGNRSITDGIARTSRMIEDAMDEDNGTATPPSEAHDGLGERQRSWSPEADQWENLLTTITADPSLPSAESSFDAASLSQSADPRTRNNNNAQRQPQRPISALREYIGARPARTPRPDTSANDSQIDDNCPAPVVPSQPAEPIAAAPMQSARLSFGEIAPDSEPIPPEPSTPVTHEDLLVTPRQDGNQLLQRLYSSQRESRTNYLATNDYFASFIGAFSRGERTASEAQLTIRAFDRLGHYMSAERTYHRTRMPARARQREQDGTLSSLRTREDHDEAERWLIDHIADFDVEQSELQDAFEEAQNLRELASRRPLDGDELTRRDRATRVLGDAVEQSRRARVERISADIRRGNSVRERL